MNDERQELPAGLQDRAAGSLVGAALGDAFGMPLEFGPPQPVPVRELTAGRLPVGRFTDDTEMMLALAESLLASRPLDPDDLARRFVQWYQGNPPDIGNQTRAVLARMARGIGWEQAVSEATAGNSRSAGNGSVMRCFPVALAYWDDLGAALEQSRLQSRVTHPDGESQDACAFVNAVIWHALHGLGAVEAIEQALADAQPLEPALRAAIRAAPARQARELPNSGWVRHTVESAVWGLLTTANYEEAVIQVANLGNDADSAAAVAGAMAGAVYGLQGIPREWQEELHGPWPVRGGRTWRASDFERLSGDLLQPKI